MERQSTEGRAVLLLMAKGIPQHIAEAAVGGAATWPGDYPIPEIQHLSCPLDGDFHESAECLHKACEFVTGRVIFG